MRLGIAAPLQWIVPAEVRVTVVMLGLFGIHAGAAGNQLVVWNFERRAANALHFMELRGWQSLILLGLSLIVGLRGPMTVTDRIQVIAVGVLARCSSTSPHHVVCLLAALGGLSAGGPLP